MRMRYTLLEELGTGSFGTVYKARDPSTGRLFAVKILLQASAGTFYQGMALAYRGERVILPQLDHLHIIRSFHSQGWGTPRVEIAMELMDGTLQSLVGTLDTPCPALPGHVLYQMLQALDYLSRRGCVHRDVKPENIFYTSARPVHSNTDSGTTLPCPYHFRLGDFGLCETESSTAMSRRHGTMLYMAPELFYGHWQSHKSDVWALYVTMLWAMDVRGFRTVGRLGQGCHANGAFTLRMAGAVRRDGRIEALRGMAMVDPSARATAGEMLEKLFGEGRVVEVASIS